MEHMKGNTVQYVAETTVQKWGNSLAMRLPKDIATVSNIEQGTKLEFKVLENGNILITPSPTYKVRKKYSLDALLAQCQAENRPEIIDFGIEGRESL